jgi:hypothetical protein
MPIKTHGKNLHTMPRIKLDRLGEVFEHLY